MSTLKDVDPATGETIAEIPVASAEEVERVVRAARDAQEAWAAVGFAERRALLVEAGKRLDARAGEVAATVTREMGKLEGDALREVRAWTGGGLERFFEEVERALEVEVLREGGVETRIERDPLGVVAAITPWNYPVGMPLELVLPALAAGNACVLKPSEHVPLVGALLHEVFARDLPAGVFGLVQGAGDVGARLVAADVDMIAFVGSRETGIRIMEAASGGLKRLVLELGGKDPLVVFEDADLEAAAEVAVRHALRNTGQVCCSVERVYVAAGVYEEFEKRVVEKARAWRYGSGFDKGVQMGPLVSKEQREKVEAQVRRAREAGARVVLGGERPEGPGWFYPATVIADVAHESEVTRRETFGPVVALTRFSGGEDEAVKLANDTAYGLGANVFTRDLERGKRVARRIRSGQVGVNRYLGGVAGTPWVGARQSGFGFIGGVEGHRQFTVPKSISYSV